MRIGKVIVIQGKIIVKAILSKRSSMLIMESTISGQLLGLLNDPSRFGKNPMDTVADDIIIGWCDLDPKTRYRGSAAVVRLLEWPNDKAPYEWASLTRQLLLKAPDPEAVFHEIVDRLHPTSWSGSPATELEARLTLLDQLDINAVPELAAALDATKATLKDRTELERRRETVEDRERNGRFKKRSIARL
jgi:hypothetical protein